jgi:hypothetical protein
LRMPIALCTDILWLRQLAAMVRPGSGARLELVLPRGRRMRIAQGANEVELRSLFETAIGENEKVRIELVME